MMEDDLIGDSGFELDTTRQDLRRAHETIAGMIVMYRDGSKELAALKIEHERLKWTLSDVYRREGERETAQMGYAYGDYTKREKQ